MGIIKPWDSPYADGTAIDTKTDMPDLHNIADDHRVSHPLAIKAAAIAIEDRLGLQPGGDPCWSYLDLGLPSGVSSSVLEGLWQLDGTPHSVDDRSGNGHALMFYDASGGFPEYYGYGEAYGEVGGLTGFSFVGGTGVATDTGHLNLSANFTIELEVLMQPYIWLGQLDFLRFLPNGWTTEWDEPFLLFGAKASGSCYEGAFYYLEDVGAGIANYHSSYLLGGLIPSNMTHVVFVRESGNMKVYVQGSLLAQESGCWSHVKAHSMPGTNGAAYDIFFGGQEVFMYLFSARMFTQALSAAQVLESYQRIRQAS